MTLVAVNRWQCPLTAVAARYTDDRRDNFDIYLPEWLARHNKLIFGGLFAVGQVVVLSRCLMSLSLGASLLVAIFWENRSGNLLIRREKERHFRYALLHIMRTFK